MQHLINCSQVLGIAASTRRCTCRKLVDTPFPFPWAQAVTITLLVFSISAPFLIAAFTTSILLSTLMTFVAVHTYIMLNEVARDVEDPFHYDPNELPLPQIQYRLNERLLAVSKTSRPVAFTDWAELAGPGNVPAVPDPPYTVVCPPATAVLWHYCGPSKSPQKLCPKSTRKNGLCRHLQLFSCEAVHRSRGVPMRPWQVVVVSSFSTLHVVDLLSGRCAQGSETFVNLPVATGDRTKVRNQRRWVRTCAQPPEEVQVCKFSVHEQGRCTGLLLPGYPSAFVRSHLQPPT